MVAVLLALIAPLPSMMVCSRDKKVIPVDWRPDTPGRSRASSGSEGD